jgi:TonB family protein
VSEQPVAASHEAAKPAANSSAPVTAAREVQPAPAQPKKPILGDVHLATPVVHRNRAAQDGGEAAPNLDAVQAMDNGDALGSGLAAGNSTPPAVPAAPLPVGGDVQAAKIIASVAPVYPALAKSQHVSGDVKIDALIDVNGRVTTMKILSGPPLLQEAAMDALRQWKYQPATLDGKPVPMHLTVTLRFRSQ